VSVLDTLRAATPLRKSVPICLDGALQAEWDQVLERLDEAGKNDANRGSLAMPETTKLVDQLDEIRAKMAASEVTFTFERIPWGRRLALQAEHPPRDGNPADLIRGRNIETYFPALVRASCVSAKDADGDEAVVPDDLWDTLLGVEGTAGILNFKQVNSLFDAANYVNEGESTVPPSARSLLESQDFGASLAQPSPGTSPRSGSAGGSRRGSRKSSTKKTAGSDAT